MKIKLGIFSLIVFIVTSVIANGQTFQKDESIEYKLERLKIQAQYSMDSVKLITEKKLFLLRSEAQDSLDKIKVKGQVELASLQKEAQMEMEKLSLKASKGLFNGALRQRNLEKKYSILESVYSMKMSSLELKYENAINRIELKFDNKIQIVASEAQLQLKEIESNYKKEVALLELELRK